LLSSLYFLYGIVVFTWVNKAAAVAAAAAADDDDDYDGK